MEISLRCKCIIIKCELGISVRCWSINSLTAHSAILAAIFKIWREIYSDFWAQTVFPVVSWQSHLYLSCWTVSVKVSVLEVFFPAMTSKRLDGCLTFNKQQLTYLVTNLSAMTGSHWPWLIQYSETKAYPTARWVAKSGAPSFTNLFIDISSSGLFIRHNSFFPSVCSLDSSLSLYKPLHHEWSICAFPVFPFQK